MSKKSVLKSDESELPSLIYNSDDPILEKLITAPPAPHPHNAATEALINTAPRRQGRPRKEATTPKTTISSQPEQQPQQHSPLQSQQPQQPLQQQSGLSSTRPKTMASSTQSSQGPRQSQRLRARQQEQQPQQRQPGSPALSGHPPAAP